MRKKLVLGLFLVLSIFAVSLIANVQACGTTNGKDKARSLPLVAYNIGTVERLPPPPPFHLELLGSGVASHMGRISLAGDELDTFDKPPPLATQVSFTGTVSWTDKRGDTVTITYQGTAKLGEGFQGTFKISGGTGRFEGVTGGGKTWGTAEVNPATHTGTFTQWFVGAISY